MPDKKFYDMQEPKEHLGIGIGKLTQSIQEHTDAMNKQTETIEDFMALMMGQITKEPVALLTDKKE